MKFDPKKPYMRVFGQDPKFPGAKYQQGPYVYTATHKLVGGEDPKDKVGPAEEAKNEVVAKLTKSLESATDKLEEAQAKFDAEQTTATKTALTKAQNKYDAVREELAELAS